MELPFDFLNEKQIRGNNFIISDYSIQIYFNSFYNNDDKMELPFDFYMKNKIRGKNYSFHLRSSSSF
jgi:hypothetical protein